MHKDRRKINARQWRRPTYTVPRSGVTKPAFGSFLENAVVVQIGALPCSRKRTREILSGHQAPSEWADASGVDDAIAGREAWRENRPRQTSAAVVDWGSVGPLDDTFPCRVKRSSCVAEVHCSATASLRMQSAGGHLGKSVMVPAALRPPGMSARRKDQEECAERGSGRSPAHRRRGRGAHAYSTRARPMCISRG